MFWGKVSRCWDVGKCGIHSFCCITFPTRPESSQISDNPTQPHFFPVFDSLTLCRICIRTFWVGAMLSYRTNRLKALPFVWEISPFFWSKGLWKPWGERKWYSSTFSTKFGQLKRTWITYSNFLVLLLPFLAAASRWWRIKFSKKVSFFHLRQLREQNLKSVPLIF